MRVAAGLLLSAACATAKPPGSETRADEWRLTIGYPERPIGGFPANVGERFVLKPVATCIHDNGRQAAWSITGASVVSGELPDGLVIEKGVISGIPKKPGVWRSEIEFQGLTCAGHPQLDTETTVKIWAQ